MLPIRLGMVNADGPQELFVFALTRSGRVEPTNYRTTRLPSDVNVPVYVKEEFPDFYRDLFGHHVEQERMRTVVLEHAWDLAWCDPCAADPLTVDRAARPRRVLGRRRRRRTPPTTCSSPASTSATTPRAFPTTSCCARPAIAPRSRAATCCATPGREASAARRPAPIARACRPRWEEEAQALADLTGWDLADIRARMGLDRPGHERRAALVVARPLAGALAPEHDAATSTAHEYLSSTLSTTRGARMSYRMTKQERETFLAGVHVAVLALDRARPRSARGADLVRLRARRRDLVHHRARLAQGKAPHRGRAREPLRADRDRALPVRERRRTGDEDRAGSSVERDTRPLAHRYLGTSAATATSRPPAARKATAARSASRCKPERWFTVDYGKVGGPAVGGD